MIDTIDKEILMDMILELDDMQLSGATEEAFMINENERDILIDALSLYKEMNT